ncbi:MAG: hypothetical protein ABFD58_00220, partial [Anaerolineaceae bacterium]
YYEIAIRFTHFDNFFITYKSIGYPILLGCWFLVFNSTSLFTAKLFNLFCYMLLLITAFLFCKDKNFSKIYKITFISLLAFCPLVLFYTNTLGCELISILLVMIMTFLYTHPSESNLKWISLGIIIAILSLVKSYFMFFPFIIICIELLGKKIKFYKPVLMLITFFMVLSPFTYKTTQLTGTFSLVPSNGGIVLYRNNNDANRNGIVQNYKIIIPPEGIIDEMEAAGLHYEDEYKSAQKYYSKYGKDWILQNVDKFIQLGFIRINKVLFDPSKLHYPLHMFQYNDYGEKTRELTKNFIIHSTDAIMNIYSGCLVIFLFLAIIMIPGAILGKIQVDRMVYLIVFSSLFQFFVFFVAEGQARYFITLVVNAAYAVMVLLVITYDNFRRFTKKSESFQTMQHLH